MNRDMLHLAERFVTAMERISQDVKNMSAYVYDIRCSVSHILNDKKEKERISDIAHDEGENTPPVMSAGQELFARGQHSGQYEMADERSSSHMGDSEQCESPDGVIAFTSPEPHGNSGVLFSENNTDFTEEIKAERPSEFEGNEESLDMHAMDGDSGNTDRFTEGIKAERPSEFEGNEESLDMHAMDGNSGSTDRVSINSASVVDMEEVNGIEINEEPMSPPSSNMSNEAPSQDETVDGDNQDPTSQIDGIQEVQARTHQLESEGNGTLVHTRKNSEGRRNKCPVCEKAFKYGSNLVKHFRVHSGERPYKCNVCQKEFSQSNNRDTHMRSHTGVKPYKCDGCGKAFSVKGDLESHIRTHMGEKSFRCTLCGKAYRHRPSLTRHMRTHTTENQF